MRQFTRWGDKLGWITLALAWDTRDRSINPYRGWRVGAAVDAAVAPSDQ